MIKSITGLVLPNVFAKDAISYLHVHADKKSFSAVGSDLIVILAHIREYLIHGHQAIRLLKQPIEYFNREHRFLPNLLLSQRFFLDSSFHWFGFRRLRFLFRGLMELIGSYMLAAT